MSTTTSIQWTDATWNPIRGCSRVSAGCMNCYAETMAARFSGPGMPYAGLINEQGKWNGLITFQERHLFDPLKWKFPRRIFVNSMSDLFHENVHYEWIDRIFAVMALSPFHTFQILTKRPERMRSYLAEAFTQLRIDSKAAEINHGSFFGDGWPLKNVWLGVSIEDQKTADERIPYLLSTSAAVRFVSYEPALGPVDFKPRPHNELCLHCGEEWSKHSAITRLCPDQKASMPTHYRKDGGLNWIIVGGESGSGARQFDIQWARDVLKQCRQAGVPVFVKQLGSKPAKSCGQPEHGSDCVVPISLKDSKGADMSEWPEDLRVREFPE